MAYDMRNNEMTIHCHCINELLIRIIKVKPNPEGIFLFCGGWFFFYGNKATFVLFACPILIGSVSTTPSILAFSLRKRKTVLMANT